MKYATALAASLAFTDLSFHSSFILLFAQAAPIAPSYTSSMQRSEFNTLSILDSFDAGSLLEPVPTGQLSPHNPDSDEGVIPTSVNSLGILDPILHSYPLGWLDDEPRPGLDTPSPSPCTTEVPSATPTSTLGIHSPYKSTFTLPPIFDLNSAVEWLDDLCICDDSCDNSDVCECDEEDYVTWVCEYRVWDNSPCIWRPELDGQ